VPDVRSAIHVRTGQRASAEAIDAWLTAQRIEIIPFDDVYAACVHLLQRYEDIPDLAFVGTDWLGSDELQIVSYIRETWPRTGVVVYGHTADAPRCDFLSQTLACRGGAALRELLAATPADVARRLREQLRPLVLTPAREAAPPWQHGERPPSPPIVVERPRDG
jgi:hypothetical protein